MKEKDLNYLLKLIREEFRLRDEEIQVLHNRLIADDREFDLLWKKYKKHTPGAQDRFIEVVRELLS